MKLIAQGAEAKLYQLKDRIYKDRFAKKYRHPELDRRLRKSRTKREAKILKKLELINFPSPKIYDQDESKLTIEKIPGKLVKDIITEKNHNKLMQEIGKKVAILHNKDIIHGDLTTSNMIYNKEVFFIDFGLSFFQNKPEHRAVDLYLLRQALESKHHEIFKESFKVLIQSYKKTAKDSNLTITRLKKVESRGRNKLQG